MTRNKSVDALAGLLEILTPMSSEDRARLVSAALVLLGDTQPGASPNSAPTTAELGDLSPRAIAWLKQNALTADHINQAFHIADGVAEVIGSLPGRNKKEQSYNAYVLTGIGQLLLRGTPSFDDRLARSLCESSGCYDSANHAAYLKDRGNEFTGSKEKGWTLTAPGLKRGAEIIRQMQSASSV